MQDEEEEEGGGGAGGDEGGGGRGGGVGGVGGEGHVFPTCKMFAPLPQATGGSLSSDHLFLEYLAIK